jgi:hypothetical protein
MGAHQTWDRGLGTGFFLGFFGPVLRPNCAADMIEESAANRRTAAAFSAISSRIWSAISHQSKAAQSSAPTATRTSTTARARRQRQSRAQAWMRMAQRRRSSAATAEDVARSHGWALHAASWCSDAPIYITERPPCGHTGCVFNRNPAGKFGTVYL